jgi:hypothetical protein
MNATPWPLSDDGWTPPEGALCWVMTHQAGTSVGTTRWILLVPVVPCVLIVLAWRIDQQIRRRVERGERSSVDHA